MSDRVTPRPALVAALLAPAHYTAIARAPSPGASLACTRWRAVVTALAGVASLVGVELAGRAQFGGRDGDAARECARALLAALPEVRRCLEGDPERAAAAEALAALALRELDAIGGVPCAS